jgi:hypothetical protein
MLRHLRARYPTLSDDDLVKLAPLIGYDLPTGVQQPSSGGSMP